GRWNNHYSWRVCQTYCFLLSGTHNREYKPYCGQQYLMTGDILFINSIGRPDLAGKADAWVDDLRQTLYARYTDLSKNLIVLPAHFGQMDEINDNGTVQERL